MYQINLSEKTFDELLFLFNCNLKENHDFNFMVSAHLICKDIDYMIRLLPELSMEQLRGVMGGFGAVFFKQMKIFKNKKISKKRVIEIVIQYVDHENEFVAAAAIGALSSLKFKKWSKLEPHINHPSPYVRAAVLRFYRNLCGVNSKKLIIKSLSDTHPEVREVAIDELLEIATSDDIPLMVAFLNDSDMYVNHAAQLMLEFVATWPLDDY
ncbi:HEAT repeat domain-containing protein [Pseudomonas sp. F1_0610]|uniref:HEAT repeat domain-containing protein n=1 Tax=Pseudomonas sp. F1_0610 TaxID=3114284 RepID=UPI0039C0F8B0